MKSVPRPRSFFSSIHLLLFLPLAALLLATPVLAQQKPKKNWLSGRFDLFAEGGGSFFTPGNVQTSTVDVLTTVGVPSRPLYGYNLSKSSLHAAGRLFVGADFWLTPHDALELSYSYSPANETTTLFSFFPTQGTSSYTSSISESLRAHFFSLDYLRKFQINSRWNWYLAAGIGTVNWRGRNYSSANFAANLGTAVSYRVTSRWGLRVDYRDFIISLLQTGSLVNNHAPTIGPVFHF
jgi:hypothetical protein